MKILMIDKYFFIKGGAERYVFELSQTLEKKGHQVIPFSMKHPKNFLTPYEKYFVDHVDYNDGFSPFSLFRYIQDYTRMIYSVHAQKQLTALLEYEKPDIAHIHMIDHQISPSILKVLKSYSIPVIQTIHQYKLVCPNYRLYNERTFQVCEKCLSGHYFHPMIERCHKSSAIRGAMLGLEMSIHKLFKLYEKYIDCYHVPSQFMGEILKKNGFRQDKIFHLFYSLNIDDYQPCFEPKNYIIYFGRLSIEKGILTLMKAMQNVVTTKLYIVGDGPQRRELEQFKNENQLDHVHFLGIKSGDELKQLVAQSKFVVVPSEWYDNSPLVIYEAFALGKPVIGSDMGGIPELIDHEKNGLVFSAGNKQSLEMAIHRLLKSPSLIQAFGQAAREKADHFFSPESHYPKMMDLYRFIMNH